MPTAMTDRKIIEAALAAGATDYVTTSFELVELGICARNAKELVEARRAATEVQTSPAPASRSGPVVGMDEGAPAVEI